VSCIVFLEFGLKPMGAGVFPGEMADYLDLGEATFGTQMKMGMVARHEQSLTLYYIPC
jgi:hypothetical protein